MKTVILKNKLVALALFALVSVSFSPALANETKSPNTSVDLRYVGEINQSPVYQLLLNNTNDKYLVDILDAEGNVIYRESVNGTQSVRNYQLAEDFADQYSLHFVVTNLNTKKSTEYSVQKSVKKQDTINVTKVK